jgi:hypothetical protein
VQQTIQAGSRQPRSQSGAAVKPLAGSRPSSTRILILSVLIFAGAFGTHEVMHLLVIYAVGGHGVLVVRPWRLGLVDYSIYSLHAQPDETLDLLRQSLVNFLGPALAALPLLALLLNVRERVARVALAANVVILAFYAVIETADLVLEARFGLDLPVLTTPEFNYGVPALIIIVSAVLGARVNARPDRSGRT